MELIFSASNSCAQGGPPFLTDDSGTPGDGNWENNFAFVFNGSKNDYAKDFPVADINYGYGDRTQLKAELGFVAGKGERLSGKLDYISLGVKYRFLDEKISGVSVSTFPQAISSFNTPDKSNIAEYGFLLPIEISKEFFGVNINGQTGFQLLGSKSEWVFGVVLGYDIGRSTLLAELHTTLEKDSHQTFFDLGAQINVSSHFTILLAIGKDIGSPSFSSPNANYYSYLGLQVLL